MTIAVLMSVYKNEKPDRLSRCLLSIWDEQTRKPDQVILVEDGPIPIELHVVINEWKIKLKDKMEVLSNEENLGLTKSLNKGILVVKTDLIARMDTDDQSTPKRFEVQERFLSEHPDIDILGGAYNIMNGAGIIQYAKFFKKSHEDMMKQIYWRCPLSHPTVMMRTSLFTKKGLKYDERFRNSQDIALWVDAAMVGCRFANTDDVVLNFTEDEDVYKRRGKVRAMTEYKSFSRAAKLIYGRYSWRRILPIMRYCFRRMPIMSIKIIYQSKWFKNIYKKSFQSAVELL